MRLPYLIALLSCVVTASGWAQAELGPLRELWRSGRYANALDGLLAYREQPYGRTAEVDYMIATSACRIPQKRNAGSRYFQWMLAYYSLDPSARSIVETERRSCASSAVPTAVDFASIWATWGSAGVKGKAYYWLNKEDAALGNMPVQIVRDIPVSELAARLFTRERQDSAVVATRRRAGLQFVAQGIGPFVIASASGQSNDAIKTMARSLQKYMDFFQHKYGIPRPDYLITLYLVPHEEAFRQLAEDLHGIRVQESSIGYSFRDDLSIVAVIPGTVYGTVAHELFHLMIRSRFGDIPAWLDEGTAALYEVSRTEGDSVYGIPNWRGKVLQRFMPQRPKVGDIVRMDWKTFDAAGEDFESSQQAVNHATARYFVLYLQQNNRLFDVHHAFRSRSAEQIHKDPGEDSVARLESILGRSLEDVDQDFLSWFVALNQ